ncbi:MAG TPA: hypothetical protein VH370_26675 [Humisphaera sp.]|jgi:fatty acid desaturase|nr:hypothetical protein [Humisphaera sp.]
MELSIHKSVNHSWLARWSLPRVLMLLLGGAFVGLMMDIRVEHVDVVHRRSVAWLPILYCGLMAVASVGATFVWNSRARRLMIVLFLLAFLVGGTGFFLHNQGHIGEAITGPVHAWIDPKMSHSDSPPQLAPLSFAGLGMIGILASLRRFNEPAGERI